MATADDRVPSARPVPANSAKAAKVFNTIPIKKLVPLKKPLIAKRTGTPTKNAASLTRWP